MNPIFLRVCAAVVTALGSAAGVIAANPELIQTALPPNLAAAVSVSSLVIVAMLHELVHTSAPAAAPADPAAPKESP
jgi:hypothetical protein